MKKITKIILVLLIFIIPNTKVLADATASASIKVSTSSTVVGNSGTATLTISSNENIGQIYGTFTCGGLGKTDLKYSVTDNPSKSRTYTINWKAKTTGTYTCTVEGLEIGTLESVSWPKATITPKTIKVVSSSSNNSSSSSSGSSSNSNSSGGTTSNKKEYSSDNTLKSLSIDNYDISPKFDKDTTEYKLTVDESVEKIKINAKTNHEKASVTGTGEVNLSSGENTLQVKVTAENGNEKIYKIIVTVEDQNPIKVKVDKEEFTIVKKNNNLIDKPEHYEETTIKIDEQDVIAYINSKTKVTLVLLKDKDSKLYYYIYNEKTNEYSKYKYIKIQNVTLQLLDPTEKLKNYNLYKINIDEKAVNIYKINKTHKVGLIYGTNIATGNTDYYVYDEIEGTLGKYFDDELKIYEQQIDNIKNYAMIIIGVLSFIIIIIIVTSLINGKRRRNRRK